MSSIETNEELSIGPLLNELTSNESLSLDITSLQLLSVTDLSATCGERDVARTRSTVGSFTPLVIDCDPDSNHSIGTLRSERPIPAPRRSQGHTTEDIRGELKTDKSKNTGRSVPIPLPVLAQNQSQSTATSAPEAPPRQNQTASEQLQPGPITSDADRMFKLRGYQVEISKNILRYWNDIIILPTGTGKTPIAINAIQKHLQDYKRNSHQRYPKILFLAPRVVLVEQQLQVIQSHLPVYWAHKCTKLTGGDITSIDELEMILTDTEWSVIVATPQTIYNYFLAFNSSTMKKFSLVVFDECHHAKGGHAYNKLLNQYMDEKFMIMSELDLPQLVGLTASIGIGDSKEVTGAKSFIISLCSRFNLREHPSDVKECRQELEGVKNPPIEVIREVEELRKDPFSKFITEVIMEQILADVKRKMKETRTLCRIRFGPIIVADVMRQKFEQRCIQLEHELSRMHDAIQDHVARDCIISLKHLKVYQQALKWANLARLSDAFSFIKVELCKPELCGNEFSRRYQDEWKERLEELAAGEAGYPNNKLHVLKQELDIILSSENCQSGELPRVMIFVEYRRLAYMIRDWIREQGLGYRVERYVSPLVSPGDFGMTKEEARSVMVRFREGDLNILVATSVLSEGVDIPACNGTIRYFFIKDVIAEVQVPGRMRSWGGRVVAIFDSKLHQQYLSNKRKERLMEQALQQIREIPVERFVKLMEEEQRRDYNERLAQKRKGDVASQNKLRDSQINCRQCGHHVGQLCDIYRYLEAHHIILDKNLQIRVDISEGPEYSGGPQDGMAVIGILVCKGDKCKAELGKVTRIKISSCSRKFGSWDIEKIRLVGSASNFDKWSDASKKYVISDIKQEGLRSKVDSGHLMVE